MQPANSQHPLKEPIENAEPYSMSKCFKCCVKVPLFKRSYIKYLQCKMCINNILDRYIYMTIMMLESCFERIGSAKCCLFFVRGLFPAYLFANLAFIWCLSRYAFDNVPNILHIVINLIIFAKILLTLLLLCTDPGRMKRNSRIEKYIRLNRKDLSNIKVENEGTFPLRSNYCSISKGLYTRYETYSFYFMTAIAARNAGYYYLFMLNEVIFCVVIAACFGLNFSDFLSKSAVRLITLTFIWLIYTYKMWFDHKKIWISLSKNMTMTERQSHRKNPVFMNPSKQFYNPYDRGFCMNAVEFFIPCPLCCFCPNGDDSVFAETLKKEFPDGIKNSILSKPRSLYNIEDLQDQSYEQLARDSTVGTSRRDQENPDERKIGDSDQPSDLRYNIDAIITNSICQKFEKNKLYNWYTARIYSVVDIIGHPMHGAAKAVLSRHLENLQKIEADLQPQLSNSDEDTDGSGIYEEEGEESESEEEELNEQLDDIRKSRIKAIPKPESGSDSGAQRVGGPFMTKMQVLAQYRTIKKSKLLEFKSIEKEIPEHQREEFDRRREQFFINLEAQRDQMIEMTSQQKSSKISKLAEQEAKASDDEEGEEEEVEEEEESEEEKDEEIEHKKHKQNQFLTKITEMSKDDSQDGHNSSDAEDYKHHFEESPVKEESVEEEEPPMNVDENAEPVNEVPDFISEEAEGEKDDLEKGEGEKDDPEKEEGEEEPKEEQQPHN